MTFRSAMLVWLGALAAYGAEPPQLPRFPPKEPAAAVKTLRTQAGFRMELLAHEPLVASPVALAYDADGRAFVLEMRDYPFTDKANDKPFTERTADTPLGRIRLLTDNDGDGVFDTSIVFADNLSWPTGLAFWQGGVFVTATPDLLYLKDTDGDGKADVRETVFTGFRKFNIQAVINNLQWGLDHRIYGAGGTNGGQIRNAKDPHAAMVALGANDFCFDPRQPRFVLQPGGARFGHSFDDWGNRFLCNIRNPVIHVVLPPEYLARNPHLPVRRSVHDAAAAGDTLPVYRVSASEPWRHFRAQRWSAHGEVMPKSELVPDGYFTSACGITIYRGSAYPEEYRGQAFLADVAGNLIHRERLTPLGPTFHAQRIDTRCEFVASTDTWFRPVNFVNAPDGTLHVVDMYRETIEHPWSIPDDIKKQLDLESGRERGRIYRLAPPGFRATPPPRLSKAPTSTLVALLEHPNAWHRETAQRLLCERRDPATAALQMLLRSSRSPLGRLHALWTLHNLDALIDADLENSLRDRVAGVRAHAVRLSVPRLATNKALRNQLVSMVSDPDCRVRFQLAFALGEVRDAAALSALATLASNDADDEWLRLAVLSSVADRAGALLAVMSARTAASNSAGISLMRRQLAQVVGTRYDTREVAELLARIGAAPPAGTWPADALLGLSEGLRLRNRSLAPLLKNDAARLTHLLAQVLANAKATALDVTMEAPRRVQAVEVFRLGEFAASSVALRPLLDARQPTTLQLAVVRVLGSFDAAGVPALLLADWNNYSPPVRAEIVETILARRQWLTSVLDAVEQKQLTAADISVARRASLLRHADASIRNRAERLFKADTLAARQTVVDKYRRALDLKGENQRGRVVFERVCANCHRCAGIGHAVGPDLESVRHHAPEQMLQNLFDPNREVAPGYLEYLVTLRDGRLTSGIIVAEGVTSITLLRAGGVQETVLRQNIDEIAGTRKSLMPDGMEQQLSLQQLADLLQFLRSAGQEKP